jgi:ribosomal-protein-alanine N-acetyltransferase
MRILACADAAILAGLHQGSVAEAWTSAAFETLLAGLGVFAMVAENGGEAIGFVLARQAAEEAEVLTIASLPEHRRRGVATALIAAVAAVARNSGARTLFLEVAEDNAAARALYAREGFEEIGRRKAYYPRGPAAVDALVLRRDLNRVDAGPYV